MSNSKMSPDARELVLASLGAIYQKQATQMFLEQLQNTKDAKAIAPTVALAAISTLQHLGPKATALPEKEMWGKDGVVQSILGALFELAKEMGYDAPHSELKPAYQITEEAIDKSGFESGGQPGSSGPGQDQQQQGQPGPQQGQPGPGMGPPQGGPPGGNPMQSAAMMMGGPQ